MFDLNSAVREWRQPFREQPIYAEGAIQELEDHLLDAYREVHARSSDGEEAFRIAVQQVGSEESLRTEYAEAWKHLGAVSKYRRMVDFESSNAHSAPIRMAYRTARLGSLVVGAFGLTVLTWLVSALMDPKRLFYLGFMPDEYLYLQGRPFYLALLMTGVFNVIPFAVWRSGLGDWLRLVFVGLVGLIALHNLQVFFLLDGGPFMPGVRPIGNGAEALWWMLVVGIGPALWIMRLAWGRRTEA